MARVFLFIMDSFGIGGAPDAADFGDAGTNTFLHIWEKAKPHIPTLGRLGLGKATALSSGRDPLGVAVDGTYAAATEISNGKDTITGHWEIAGVPLAANWGYFPKTVPAFPTSLTDAMIAQAKIPGLLCLAHASGTEVLDDFGLEHIRTGKPIAYTSVDSVLQIAAHETHFGKDRLYDVCAIARELTYPLKIGRVIARPFLGEKPGAFERTGHRKDYAVKPPYDTLLDVLCKAGRDVVTIGKIADIFAHQNTGREFKVSGMDLLMHTTRRELASVKDGGFLMVNFVDFDTQYGHRRDVQGYGEALSHFDLWLAETMPLLQTGDRVVVTADHGNDPTWHGTDHTRERVPVLVWGPDIKGHNAGLRTSFSDIGQSIAHYLGVGPLAHGTYFSL